MIVNEVEMTVANWKNIELFRKFRVEGNAYGMLVRHCAVRMGAIMCNLSKESVRQVVLFRAKVSTDSRRK
jgi:hypothetical protein